MKLLRALLVPASLLSLLSAVPLLVLVGACGSSDSATPTADAAAPDAAPDPDEPVDQQFQVFDQIPQFGMYVSTDPVSYTPPPGVLMWSHGTHFVTKLTAEQQALVGRDLVARITYHAQCDNYDRLGALYFVATAHGVAPKPEDPRVELVRFVTPFSSYQRGDKAKLVYPDADLSVFASTLADTTKDIWIGVGGGSNPYAQDPCETGFKNLTPEFKAIGFKYSVDFLSTRRLVPAAAPAIVLGAAGGEPFTATPVAGTFASAGDVAEGHVTVIVSGHGSGAGGNEYASTKNEVTLNGAVIGSFDTAMDCAPYAASSPEGNPGIFQNNTTVNPRNWCPGALVPSHTFPASLVTGDNAVQLAVTPGSVPEGSYFSTSLTFTAP